MKPQLLLEPRTPTECHPCVARFTENGGCALPANRATAIAGELLNDCQHCGEAAASACAAGYTPVALNAECDSADETLGEFDTVQGCADACADKDGCAFFIYGKAGKARECYRESTRSARLPPTTALSFASSACASLARS